MANVSLSFQLLQQLHRQTPPRKLIFGIQCTSNLGLTLAAPINSHFHTTTSKIAPTIRPSLPVAKRPTAHRCQGPASPCFLIHPPPAPSLRVGETCGILTMPLHLVMPRALMIFLYLLGMEVGRHSRASPHAVMHLIEARSRMFVYVVWMINRQSVSRL